VPIQPDLSNDEWIQWARPIWYGIRESDTLQVAEARDDKDERHICPLQLGTIERCIRLWSNPGELVLSPFAGIGSEGFESVRLGRRFIGIELKPGYATVAARNLRTAESRRKQGVLFGESSEP
jgi:DNA modification methylase